MPSQSKPRTPPKNNSAYHANIQAGLDAAAALNAGQGGPPVEPRTITVGNHTTVLTGGYGPAQDPFNRRGGAPEQLPPPPGWTDQAENLNQLPNWDKLSGLEKTLVSLMPGQSHDLVAAYKEWDSSLGALPSTLLTPFRWAAQTGISVLAQPLVAGTLSLLDVGAEFTERTSGLARQFADAAGDPTKLADFQKNFQAAWYASTLFADSANLDIEYSAIPGTFGLIPDFKQIRVPNDLGGVQVLVRSRQRIAQLVAQGSNYHDATVIARDEYLASLGALAIRAQTQDLFWHLFVDPLNIVLAEIKPIERIHALREVLLGITATPEELVRFGEKVNLATKAVEEANKLGDVAKITDAEKVLSDAEAALNAAKRSGLSWAEQKVTSLFGGGDVELGAKRVINLTGGAPGLLEDTATLAGQVAGGKKNWAELAKRIILSPIQLTPQARAQEYLGIFQNWFGTNLMAAHVLPDGTHDVEGIVRQFQRYIDGVYAPEMGNMVLSVEGRTIRAAAGGFGPKMNALFGAYQDMGQLERPLLQLISETLGDTPGSIVKRLNQKEYQTVLTQFMEKLGGNAEKQAVLQQLLATNNLAELTPDVLARLGNVVGGKEFAGYTPELFLAELHGALVDHVEQQAIAQFGIKNRGLIRNMAEAMKSVESLVYLRVNPAYPVKNWINNVVTMMARGAYGTAVDVSPEAFFKEFGHIPARYGEGMGIGGAEQAVEEAGGKLLPPGAKIRQAEAGDGTLNKISNWVKGLPLGKADTAGWAGGIEEKASNRAFYTGYARSIRQITPTLMGNIVNSSPELAGLERGLKDTILHALSSATTEGELDALKLAENLNISPASAVALAERNTGMQLDQILDWGEATPWLNEMTRIAKTGDKAALSAAAKQFAEAAQAHIDDLLEKSLNNIRDEAAARVAAEGPMAFVKTWADGMDEWWAGHERHAMNMEEAIGMIRNGRKEEAYALWTDTTEKARAYWGRQWDRIDARVGGFADKADELGLPGVSDVRSQLTEWRKGWDGFFTKRDKLWGDYWEARRTGVTPPITAEDIKAQLSDGYGQMIDNELRYQRAIDQRVAQMLPPEQQPQFMAWRNRVNEYRAADKESVVAFRQKLEGLRPEQFDAAWKAHNAERIKAWNQLRQEEQAGLAAMMGSQPAQQHFAQSVATATSDRMVLDSVWPKVLAGEQLTPEEAVSVNRILDQYATVEEAARLKQLDALDVADQARGPQAPVGAPKPTAVGDKITTPYGNGEVIRFLKPAKNQAERIVIRLEDGTERVVQGAAIGPSVKLDQATLEANQALRQAERASLQTQISERIGRSQETGVANAATQAPTHMPTIPNVESIIKPELYVGTGLDQHWYMRGGDGVRSIENAFLQRMDEPPTKFGQLNEVQQTAMRDAIEQAKGALKDARYHATRMGEFTRDSALLNYNRRFNYNTWLGTMVPFEFWATQSAWKWALHSIDRPGMLAAYLRIKKFLDTAYRPEEGLPTRLKGSIRIPIPFMPDWMGNEVFVDPLRIGLPFDNWMAPLEQMNQQDIADMGAAQRKLEELKNDGQISAADYQDAQDHQTGPVWDRAMALARQDDSEGRLNPMDVVTALLPPHLPLLYALDAARGQNPFEKRGPILPQTRSLGNLLATLGVDPASALNPEAALRKQLGLHPFSHWDDYLTERMLTNMVASGDASLDDAQRAMIEHKGPAWDEALRRAGIERAGGNLITAGMGLAGVPAHGYPPGEEANRKLKDDYNAAWDRYNASGGDYAGTVGAWLKDHPGYEARLALFKKPEERLHQFLTDEFWNLWHDTPKLTQDQLKQQLGPAFVDAMLNPDTGWGQNADPGKLATWLKLMGANPPGSLQVADGQTLDLASPEVAQRAQVFYNTRNMQYPGALDLQDGYFAISDQLAAKYGVEAALVDLQEAGDDKAARNRVFKANPSLSAYYAERKTATSNYLRDNPQLSAYWKWRDSFLARNTDVAPYLSDKPVYADRAPSNGYQPQPNFTWDEWRQEVGYEVSALIIDYVDYHETMPAVAQAKLEAEMAKIGWQGDWQSFVQHIAATRQRENAGANP